MHLAKGLEFRAVAVMACDDGILPLEDRLATRDEPLRRAIRLYDGILPLEDRLATAGDESDLEEIFNTERHLLYVACTRARDYLLVTSGGEESEFLADLKGI